MQGISDTLHLIPLQGIQIVLHRMITVFICHYLDCIINSLFICQTIILFKVQHQEFQINICQIFTFPIPAQISCNVDFIGKHIQTECSA